MARKRYDFAGYCTRANLRCSDGRIIGRDAFAAQNGMTVPVVYNHDHDDIGNVLGHALLENRADGVYAYCTLNNTERGRDAKECIQNGDINALSIYANHLKQNGATVQHGEIKEVSLVLAGANPGAFIDEIVEHSDDDGASAVIYSGDVLEHSDEFEVEYDDDYQNDDIEHADKGETMTEATENNTSAQGEGKTVKQVFDTLNEEQKKAVYILVGEAVKNAKGGNDDDEDDEAEAKHSDFNEGDTDMKRNVFAIDGQQAQDDGVLSHSDIEELTKNSVRDAKKTGSLRDAFLEHADQDYGITNIDLLFPDARTITSTPEFIKRETEWVATVINGTRHTPFSRVKSVFADITADEARAKGYMKGKLKKEEVFSLLKRTTDPQTIYKKQKFERDDLLDITDFDVLAWVKSEMRIMLDEELASAILVGDGRLASDDDHISPDHIRPIVSDAELYTIQFPLEPKADEDKYHALIGAAVRSRHNYRGSGNPTMFTSETNLDEMLLLEDGIGHRLYKDQTELATAMRVSKIVTLPDEILARGGQDLEAIIVNLNDYNVGADKGGSVNMFDDFDIDYNQQKYLIETRCSGALVKPYSAIVIKDKTASATTGD